MSLSCKIKLKYTKSVTWNAYVVHMYASWMGKNVDLRSLNFLYTHKKTIFRFLNAKNGLFVKHLAKIRFKYGPP
jgi:hypothetical protein